MAEERRVVVVPLPAMGHIPSVLNLTLKLAAQGIPITLVNIESVHEKLLKSWRFPPEFDINLESIPFGLEIPRILDSQATQKRASLIDALNNLIQPFEELLRSKLQSNPACIISDYHATWTTPVAEKLGIPQISIWCGSGAWLLIEHYLQELEAQGFIPVPDSPQERIISFIPGLDPFKASELPYYLHEHNAGNSIARHLLKTSRLHTDEKILINTFSELEPREVEQMKSHFGTTRISPIGPLLDDVSSPAATLEIEDSRCLGWLDSRPESSVIYVSFGSLAALSGEQFRELALGLESQSFLWVIRPEFLAVAESEEFYNDFSSRIQEAGTSMIVSWAPQRKVLSHRSVGGFLTHCGWNSTLESIWSGVPMLGWPCNSDQNLNCRLTIEGRGIGRRIPKNRREDVVPRDVVRNSVQELMNPPPEMKRAAMELRESAWRAVAIGGSSNGEFQRLVEGLKAGV